MPITEPSSAQLTILQDVFANVAGELGYFVLSPFADRHGAFQCQFLDQATNTHLVGIAVESVVPMKKWRCEVSSVVRIKGDVVCRSSVIETFDPGHVKKAFLRDLFSRVVQQVHDLNSRRHIRAETSDLSAETDSSEILQYAS